MIETAFGNIDEEIFFRKIKIDFFKLLKKGEKNSYAPIEMSFNAGFVLKAFVNNGLNDWIELYKVLLARGIIDSVEECRENIYDWSDSCKKRSVEGCERLLRDFLGERIRNE